MSPKKSEPTPLAEAVREVLGEFREQLRPVRRAVDYLAVSTHVPPDNPTRTKIGEADHVNINNIVRRARITGMLDHVNDQEAAFGHWDATQDYVEARLAVQRAEEAFYSLPSGIRALCDNDPALFVDFIDDPTNEEALREAGLGELYERHHAPPEENPSSSEPLPASGENPSEPSASSDESAPESNGN